MINNPLAVPAINTLPVYQHKDRILSALEHSQAIVVESPTGSGKTTQLPLILDNAGYSKNGIIGVTQPRRIAAVSVSEYIARQIGKNIPGHIGYKMRFEDKTNRDTRIKIMTDGILLQEMKLDPWLSKYNCIIVDEAHERSLNIDFILGLLKRILEERRDFKVIISSATINAAVFSEYFSECPIVKIEAQIYPVTLIYDPPIIETHSRAAGEPSHLKSSAADSQAASEAIIGKIESITERIVSEHKPSLSGSEPNDILIFLPGEKMIRDCLDRFNNSKLGTYLHLIPLYGRLGKEEQERVFEKTPKGKLKTVIATNIAETSVTIDGITSVIDSGLSKLSYYNPKTFTSSLVQAPVSKSSANQRKGRAGRTREGACYRLYSRSDFENRVLYTTEEIFRTDLSEVVLRMADLGITEFDKFDFISSPGRDNIMSAIQTLKLLDALQSDNTLSNTGRLMTEFPLMPRHSRIIAEAILRYPDIIKETLIAAAFLSTQSPYLLPPGEETDARRAHHNFRDKNGDFVSYLKLYRAYLESEHKKKFCEKSYLDERAMAEIANIVTQLELILADLNIPVNNDSWPLCETLIETYLCAIGRGLIQFVCVREGRDYYRSLFADRILIHPGSVMFRRVSVGQRNELSKTKALPDYIVAGEIVRTTRMYAMSVSPLSKEALNRIHPELIDSLEGIKHKEEYFSKDTTDKKSKKQRDFTNNIKIAGEVFSIQTIKGKKVVQLPWEKLKHIKENIKDENIAYYKGLRGTIIINDNYLFLKREKLSLIMMLLPSLDFDKALEDKSNADTEFNSHENLDQLLEQLPLIVSPALLKKHQNKTKKQLGFTGLYTDGYGNYWIRATRNFHTSLNESIASLEILIDELDGDVDIEKKHIVNQCYRRLSDYVISQ